MRNGPKERPDNRGGSKMMNEVVQEALDPGTNLKVRYAVLGTDISLVKGSLYD